MAEDLTNLLRKRQNILNNRCALQQAKQRQSLDGKSVEIAEETMASGWLNKENFIPCGFSQRTV